MITDFQTIAEPLIKTVFPASSAIQRTDECRGVVHLDFVTNDTAVRLSWEPYGPPWAQITNGQVNKEQVWIDSLKIDDVLVSPDMKTEMETREILRAIERKLK